MSTYVPDYYIVCLGNSELMSRYSETFINFTVNFQINDARILPIIIPNANELKNFKTLFDKALEIKKNDTSPNADSYLREELNDLVNKLYLIDFSN